MEEQYAYGLDAGEKKKEKPPIVRAAKEAAAKGREILRRLHLFPNEDGLGPSSSVSRGSSHELAAYGEDERRATVPEPSDSGQEVVSRIMEKTDGREDPLRRPVHGEDDIKGPADGREEVIQLPLWKVPRFERRGFNRCQPDFEKKMQEDRELEARSTKQSIRRSALAACMREVKVMDGEEARACEQSITSDFDEKAFPDANLREDLWELNTASKAGVAESRTNPVNESLRKHRQRPLSPLGMIQLQKLLIMAAVRVQRRTTREPRLAWLKEKVTWRGFARPYLLLFADRLRSAVSSMEEDRNWTTWSTFGGCHALLLCKIVAHADFHEASTIGDCLRKCYERRALSRCKDRLGAGCQMLLIVAAFSLVDPLLTPYTWYSSYSPETLFSAKFDQFFVLGETSIESTFDRDPSVPVKPCKEETFEADEMSLPSISKGTSVEVEWVHGLEDHLLLKKFGNRYVLRVYWPIRSDMVASRSDRAVERHDFPNAVLSEVLSTYEILFNSSYDLKVDIEEYGKLRTPRWLITTRRGALTSRAVRFLTLGGLFRPDPFRIDRQYQHLGPACENIDIAIHLGARLLDFPAEQARPSDKFEDYMVYGTRLRVLKQFMDHERPRTFKQLWRDSRNTEKWYAFWAVIVVGVITIVFAAASFAVGAAQTAATFQALQLQLSSMSQGPPD